MPELLAALAAGPATLAELIARLGADHALQADADTIALLTERLEELQALGLVWQE